MLTLTIPFAAVEHADSFEALHESDSIKTERANLPLEATLAAFELLADGDLLSRVFDAY